MMATKPASTYILDSGNSLATNLVGCWPMLEGSGTTTADKSTSNITATLAAGLTWNSPDSEGPNFNTYSTSGGYLTLASNLAIPINTSFSVAWGAYSEGGIVCGDHTNAGQNFLWPHGSLCTLWTSMTGNIGFSWAIDTNRHDYVLSVAYAAGGYTMTVYQDGTSLGTASGTAATPAWVINAIMNGYPSPGYTYPAQFEYFYVWSGRALAGTDATALNTNPYSILKPASSATLTISPTSGVTGSAPRIAATGTNTLWTQDTPSTLFSVSGSTDASISSISVSSDTTASFILTVGTVPGVLTITDTSTGNLESFTASSSSSVQLVSEVYPKTVYSWTDRTGITQTDFTGTGASGQAAITASVVSTTKVSGGSGYTSAPTITWDGAGNGLVLTAVVSGGSVVSVDVVSGGALFTGPPTLTFVGGGGTGANFTANMGPYSVTSISPISLGENYYSVPSVTLVGGGGTGAYYTAILNSMTNKIVGYAKGSAGTGYTSAPAVVLLNLPMVLTEITPISTADAGNLVITADSSVSGAVIGIAVVFWDELNNPINISSNNITTSDFATNSIGYYIAQSISSVNPGFLVYDVSAVAGYNIFVMSISTGTVNIHSKLF